MMMTNNEPRLHLLSIYLLLRCFSTAGDPLPFCCGGFLCCNFCVSILIKFILAKKRRIIRYHPVRCMYEQTCFVMQEYIQMD